MIVFIFFLLFSSKLTAPNVKDNYIFARKHFTFPKNVLDKTWKSRNTKLGPQWKLWKSSYQTRYILVRFSNSVVLILD